jgi:mono/diheme cytochrome c family protein
MDGIMKKHLIISSLAAIVFGMVGCKGAGGNYPGDAYAPDMYYSRAYEAYGYNTTDRYYKNLADRGIHFNGLPVAGTMARGDVATYPFPGDDSGYVLSVNFRNPNTTAITEPQRKEAERLYLVNCAICHGTNLDGNGPLYKGGEGPYPAAPRNLKDDYSKKLADGQIYHVITYGKGQMGSYASNIKPEERWWMIQYIREKQGTGGAAQSNSDSTQIGGVPAGGAAGGTGTTSSGGSMGTSTGRGTSTNGTQQ